MKMLEGWGWGGGGGGGVGGGGGGVKFCVCDRGLSKIGEGKGRA